jgi:amino acid transporter
MVGFDAMQHASGSTVFALGRWARSPARPLFDALVAVASIGGGAVGLMSGARVVYAVARDGLLFAPLARVSSRGVPAVAIVVCGALAVLYARSPLAKLGEVFVVGAWPFYALGALAVVRLRRSGAFEQAQGTRFVTPLFPWPQRVFALVSAAIVLGYAVREPRNTAISLGVVALGLLGFPLTRAR